MPSTEANQLPEIRRVNRAGLARIFGATLAEIDKWVGMGCPYIKRAAGKGDAWVFDTADVANWMIERARKTGRALLQP